MSDTQPSQRAIAIKPEEKPTVEMAPPPAWAIKQTEALHSLGEKLAYGFERVNSDMAVVKNRQEVQAAQMKDLGGEIGRLGERVDKLEGRSETNSTRVKATTEDNIKQDAAIASILIDVAALKETQAAQLAILERLDKIAANPMVRRVAYAVATAALGYLAAKGYLR
jgi:hypothetical protein